MASMSSIHTNSEKKRKRFYNSLSKADFKLSRMSIGKID